MKATKLFALLALLCASIAFSACSKDESDSIVGTWRFNDSNVILYWDNDVYNAKEEGDVEMLDDFNRTYRGLFFTFNGGKLIATMNGQTGSAGSYTISGDKITIKDGSSVLPMTYKVYGNKLDLLFNRSSMEMFMGALPNELYMFDEVEFILTFNKVD